MSVIEDLLKNNWRTLAIDPGYDRLGWAVGEKNSKKKLSLLKYGLIATNKKDSHYQRYTQINTELEKIIDQYRPQNLALETLFFQKNQKTVMAVSEVRGIIMSAGFRHQLQLYEYTPPQIKQAMTGYGRADKLAIEKMVRLEFALNAQEKIIDDTIDAMALLLTQLTDWRNNK